MSVCLTTFVSGEKYQSYIPFLIYSCQYAYPEYDIIIFVNGNLIDNVRDNLNFLRGKYKFIIRENIFDDCPHMTPLKSKALRWCIWDDLFEKYDYLYTVDIDMFYIREPIPLHIQHLQHMKYTGLPISNIRRIYKRNPWNFSQCAQRIKHAGFQSFLKYFFSNKYETRLSGLHFVDIKEWYSRYDVKMREAVKNEIYTGCFLQRIMYPNNEIYLADLTTRLGIDIKHLGIQTSNAICLDFRNPARDEFRPHHGIHMGIFRADIEELKQEDCLARDILDSGAYEYYLSHFKREVACEDVFQKLLDNSNHFIQSSFKKLFLYYSIDLGNIKE